MSTGKRGLMIGKGGRKAKIRRENQKHIIEVCYLNQVESRFDQTSVHHPIVYPLLEQGILNAASSIVPRTGAGNT